MHRTKNFRRAFVATVSAVALAFTTVGLGALPATAVDEAAVSTSSISGTVTDAASSAPLAGASVVVLDASGAEAGSTLTGDTGGYTVSGLAEGAYRVSVSLAPSHSPVFWPAAADPDGAESVSLAVAEARTGIDVALSAVSAPSESLEVPESTGGEPAPESKIEAPPAEPEMSAFVTAEEVVVAEAVTYTVSGRVTDTSGDPIAGATIYISGQSSSSTSTLADGTYAFSGLVAGDYNLSASATGYIWSSWSLFNLAADATNIDFELIATATVSGTVTTSGGAPATGWVRIVIPATGVQVGGGSVAPDGNYTVTGIQPGTFVVHIDPDDATLAPQYFDAASRLEDATSIVVAEGSDITDIDFSLETGRTITGVVSPAPVVNGYTYVEARPVGGGLSSAYAVPQADGSYSFTGLTPDSYIVKAFGTTATGNIGQGYYEATADEAEATPVSVLDSDRADIDVQLFDGVRIQGTISAADDPAPFQNTQITAYQWDGGSWEAAASISGWGAYVFGSVSGWANYLDPGTYTVGFSDPGAPYGVDPAEWVYPYCDQFYDLAPTIDSAESYPTSRRVQ